MSNSLTQRKANKIPPFNTKKGQQDPIGEENETFFIRVWKPLTSKHVLTTFRGSLKGKGQYLLVVGLDHYKWYQSQTPSDVLARRLSLEGEWTQDYTRLCANKDVDHEGSGDWGVPHRGNECQR